MNLLLIILNSFLLIALLFGGCVFAASEHPGTASLPFAYAILCALNILIVAYQNRLNKSALSACHALAIVGNAIIILLLILCAGLCVILSDTHAWLSTFSFISFLFLVAVLNLNQACGFPINLRKKHIAQHK